MTKLNIPEAFLYISQFRAIVLRLLLRAPGLLPFGTCICSYVDTILFWTCHVYVPFEFRTSLGTSISLNLQILQNYCDMVKFCSFCSLTLHEALYSVMKITRNVIKYVCHVIPFTFVKVRHTLGVSQYIDISVYRNTRRTYIVSQYEIRIAIYRDFSFFYLNCVFFIQFLSCSNFQVQKMHSYHTYTLIKGLHTVMYSCI